MRHSYDNENGEGGEIMPMPPPIPQDTWKYRRRFMVAVLIFCAFVILFILITDRSNAVAESAVVAAFGVGTAIVGGYIFGAVYEDTRNAMRTGIIVQKQHRRPPGLNQQMRALRNESMPKNGDGGVG